MPTEWAKRAPKPMPKRYPGLPKVYIAYREDLLRRPGRWAKWPVPLNSVKAAFDVCYQINTNRRPTFPAKQFDAREEDGVLYVRARPKKKRASRDV